MSWLDAVDWLAEQEVRGIEFVDFSPPDSEGGMRLAQSLAERCRQHGIRPVAYAAGTDLLQPDSRACAAEVARVKKKVDQAAALGVQCMRHDICRKPAAGVCDSGGWQRVFESVASVCREVADYAAECGVTMCVENRGQTTDHMLKLVTSVDHPNFRILIDMANFLRADEDPVLGVRRLAPHATHVHIRDFHYKAKTEDPGEGWPLTAGKNYIRGAILGHGDVDVRGCVRALKEAGYGGWYSVEFVGLEDARLAVRMSLDNARRYLASQE